jgi:hypothetical protein
MGMLRTFRKGRQYKDRAGAVNPNGALDGETSLEALFGYSASDEQALR